MDEARFRHGRGRDGGAGRRRGGARAVPVVLALLLCAGVAGAGDPPAPGPRDRCPVCGMFVARFPGWVAAVRFRDGTHSFFDGPKDLFRFWLDPGRYDRGRSAGDLAAAYVTEYYTARLVGADGVRFVAGSDVLGPMGRELVPVSGDEEVATFLRDHRGQRAYRFEEVTASVLSGLQ